jgi:predicted O-methyltransferase YrrM
MKSLVKKWLNKLPYIRTLVSENKRLTDNSRLIKETYESWVPPGHYYSPIPSVNELQEYKGRIYDESKIINGIDLNAGNQILLLDEFRKFYKDLDFTFENTGRNRFYYDNPSFKEPDAVILYSVIRNLKPQKIIEIGSGFTSALMLDINEKFFNNSIDLTFVEPFPDLLLSLLKEEDKTGFKLIPEKTQDLDITLFDELNAGDLLFIDSTHVSKTGSDVNTIFFEILPRIKKGVIIHFHDVVFPFEYPEEWVFNTNGRWKGFSWNESFMLRAFLMFNDRFSIYFFGSYMVSGNRDFFNRNMPLFLKSIPGSIYLQKVK